MSSICDSLAAGAAYLSGGLSSCGNNRYVKGAIFGAAAVGLAFSTVAAAGYAEDAGVDVETGFAGVAAFGFMTSVTALLGYSIPKTREANYQEKALKRFKGLEPAKQDQIKRFLSGEEDKDVEQAVPSPGSVSVPPLKRVDTLMEMHEDEEDKCGAATDFLRAVTMGQVSKERIYRYAQRMRVLGNSVGSASEAVLLVEALPSWVKLGLQAIAPALVTIGQNIEHQLHLYRHPEVSEHGENMERHDASRYLALGLFAVSSGIMVSGLQKGSDLVLPMGAYAGAMLFHEFNLENHRATAHAHPDGGERTYTEACQDYLLGIANRGVEFWNSSKTAKFAAVFGHLYGLSAATSTAAVGKIEENHEQHESPAFGRAVGSTAIAMSLFNALGIYLVASQRCDKVAEQLQELIPDYKFGSEEQMHYFERVLNHFAPKGQAASNPLQVGDELRMEARLGQSNGDIGAHEEVEMNVRPNGVNGHSNGHSVDIAPEHQVGVVGVPDGHVSFASSEAMLSNGTGLPGMVHE